MNFSDYQEQTSKTNVYSDSIDQLMNPIQSFVLDPKEDKVAEALMAVLKIKEILNIAYIVMGASGEVAELSNKFKKVVRGDKTIQSFTKEAKGEIGDGYWYLVGQLPTVLDLDAADLARDNLAKLLDRKERGVIKGDGDER